MILSWEFFIKKKGFETAVETIKNLDSNTQNTILKNLATKDAELAEALKNSLFTFEDIQKVNRKSVSVLFAEISENKWLLALRKATDELKNHLFSNISSRRAEQIKEALAQSKPQPLAKVLEAQKEIVQRILELEKAGKLAIIRNRNDELV